MVDQAHRLYGLPDISGRTAAAQGLRCLFVQNQIFSMLHQRVFQPFLLSSVYAGNDEYEPEASLAMVSKMIGAKSVRREALWRATTLRAIYASEYGRKAASELATGVSREIVEKIQFLALADGLPALQASVRSVSKAAVELWRQVRVEWKAVYSSMPSRLHMQNSHPADVMLWIRPHIVREGSSLVADVEDSEPPKAPDRVGCVYLQGTALSQNSPLVLARRQESLERTEQEPTSQETG